MSKRHGHDYEDHRNKRSRPAPPRRKHLYLVRDDWEKGYSIRKIDLPEEPAALRLVEPDALHFVPAGGSNIVIVSPHGEEKPTLVYDTEDDALAVGPPLPGRLSGPLLAAPPFDDAGCVVAHAAHPDGRTVFVSVAESTYSLDAARGEWRWHGPWALPFRGPGHFDGELGAWVGLHEEEKGYVCACQLPSRSGVPTAAPPECDVMEEKLFCRERGHLGAVLTYAGDGTFCLVESVATEEGVELGSDGDRDGCVVRVTVFGLKFNRKGELLTTNRRRSSSYVAHRYAPSFSPVAFWM
ncbi:hypothetical protein PR202_ga02640 [Eleusine coracana subsp. coracana]|uniref:DUF295 domain-containing protein n=1 Tax=Eleusine coracana subsp. coracana TaxID=191504 RepID=A0AAV5BM54_ELECO|nr:hypothetical protein PR202_ga02640 [Eleusine coracana subsp. coracana]